MTRVLFLLTQDLESPAGGGRYLPLARALVRLGHTVRIAGLHPNYRALRTHHCSTEGVDVLYVGQMHVRKIAQVKTYLPKHELFLVAANAAWRLSRIALESEADVVHLGKPHPMNGIAGILAQRIRHLPLVVDCDDLEMANNRFGGVLQRWAVSSAERLTIRAADHITTHSSVLRDYLVRLGKPKGRITYLPHGTEPHRFASVSVTAVSRLRSELGLDDHAVVAYIGSLSTVSHALEDLIAAFSMVVQRFPEAHLLMVGGGEDYEALRQQVAELGLSPYVSFCGRVSPSDVPLYYQLADISVDPVRDNDAGRASLSLKMFESWSAGVALVTVDVGDRRQVTGEPPAAIVVPPGDPGAMAEAIAGLLADPALRQTLHSRALAKADQYSWDTLARSVASLYAGLMASAKGGS